MEDRIREYEEYIWAEIEDGNRSPELVEYHREMLANFQHERAVHLAVTLFFAGVTIPVVAIAGCMVNQPNVNWLTTGPMICLAAGLAIWTGFYVKHYYFLENHIQELYKFSDELGR